MEEHENFFKSLNDLKGLVEDYIGMKLSIKEFYIGDDQVFDYTIKLVPINKIRINKQKISHSKWRSLR